MSVDYAAGLSHYDDLGICGLDEVPDDSKEVKSKVKQLADWLMQYQGSCVVHVGAGLSTAAGIPDFRGKRGVWTKLQSSQAQSKQQDAVADNGETVSQSVKEEKISEDANSSGLPTTNAIRPFDETEPTYSHLALRQLCELGHVAHIISQNVDGLFLKANSKRKFISELHGNFYLDECTRCRSRFVRGTASSSMRLQKSGIKCPRSAEKSECQVGGISCKGHLRDTILDWESPIPFNELRVATRESKRNKLHICIGTSLQLKPSMDLVCKQNNNTSRTPSTAGGNNNKLVIINLQPTQFDSKADLVIHYYADAVMRELTSLLDIEVPEYKRSQDPTKDPDLIGTMWKK